eukprot:6188214-Pleurochrysis_carterae.AAC.1
MCPLRCGAHGNAPLARAAVLRRESCTTPARAGRIRCGAHSRARARASVRVCTRARLCVRACVR